MNNFSLENFSRPKLEMPNKESKLLLHSCCAPCAGEIMEAVAASDIDTTIYFYYISIDTKTLIHEFYDAFGDGNPVPEIYYQCEVSNKKEIHF